MYKVSAEAGPNIPTINLYLKDGNEVLAHVMLIPHSPQLYEIHLSKVDRSIKGKMKGISREGIKFIFNDIKKLEKLIAMIPTSNRLACRLARCCMAHEGTLKNSFWNGEVMEDQEIFGINRSGVCQSL